MEFHRPVLLQETITALNIKKNNVYIDATLGNGGHTIEILKQGGVVYGIDQDKGNLDISVKRIKQLNLDENFHPIKSNFNRLEKIANSIINQKVDGLLLDLGLSQNQQLSSNRGFSFNDPNSLDMRLNPKSQKLTAEEIVNTYSFDQLYQIFSKQAQEIYSKPIILKIIQHRQRNPIRNGKQLADIIRQYYQQNHIRTKIDPATKIFLSLRIIVNNELENLKKILPQTLKVVKSNGSVCIISFHSGEDRIIKQFIKENLSQNKIHSASKGIHPQPKEVIKNPLSRSAILRSYKIY